MKAKIILGLLAILSVISPAYTQKRAVAEDRALVDKVLQWQMQNYLERKPTIYTKPLSELSWLNGALFRGLIEWGKYTGNEACFEFVRKIGEQYGWQLQTNVYHADHLCMGQAYCELYKIYKQPEMMAAVKERLDYMIAHPSEQEMDFRKGHSRWTWCDALFMAPPVFVEMFTITGDKKYLDFMDKEYRATKEHLFDPAFSLFYRDTNFLERKEQNGQPVFWGRGNGWVFGGLALILKDMPEDYPSYGYYVDLFKTLADAVIRYQDANGSWHASMLDHENHPTAENSGSSFFVYGLAWGVNNGILRGTKYKKAVRNGWAALKTYVDEDGRLGSIQQVAAAPASIKPESTAVYGVGAFLMAGVEMLKMNE